jgi:hypothetical protein
MEIDLHGNIHFRRRRKTLRNQRLKVDQRIQSLLSDSRESQKFIVQNKEKKPIDEDPSHQSSVLFSRRCERKDELLSRSSSESELTRLLNRVNSELAMEHSRNNMNSKANSIKDKFKLNDFTTTSGVKSEDRSIPVRVPRQSRNAQVDKSIIRSSESSAVADVIKGSTAETNKTKDSGFSIKDIHHQNPKTRGNWGFWGTNDDIFEENDLSSINTSETVIIGR